MIDTNGAHVLRVIGLAGLLLCVLLWCVPWHVKRPPSRLWLCIASGASVALYVLGAFADADSVFRSFVPPWP